MGSQSIKKQNNSEFRKIYSKGPQVRLYERGIFIINTIFFKEMLNSKVDGDPLNGHRS